MIILSAMKTFSSKYSSIRIHVPQPIQYLPIDEDGRYPDVMPDFRYAEFLNLTGKLDVWEIRDYSENLTVKELMEAIERNSIPAG